MRKDLNFSLEKLEFNEQHDDEHDDDGRIKRTGTFTSASTHIITVVIGAGVLSLAWCFNQLGWIGGIATLLIFAFITWFMCLLLSDCYRSPHPVTGTRNYTYMDAVKANLGGLRYKLCGIAQYGILMGVTIGYTITAVIAMVAITRSNCFHKKGQHDGCHTLNTSYYIIFASMEIILSQIPNINKLSFVSSVSSIMSFTYAIAGIALSIIKIAEDGVSKTSLTGIPVGKDMSSTDKMWKCFSAIGNIAFSYSFSSVLLEIQDTLKSSPAENKVMKKAATAGIFASTIFYMICGTLGYAAFGNDAPENFLSGFGFYEPFWLVDLANICIVVNLLGAYQVCIQPVFAFVESWCKEKWPQNKVITSEYSFGKLKINSFRLVWRSTFVVSATLMAMIFPFFISVLGLIGAITFWPLTIYFPIEMYISKAKIQKNSFTWIWMKAISLICLIVSLAAAAGSIRGLVVSVESFKLFHLVS